VSSAPKHLHLVSEPELPETLAGAHLCGRELAGHDFSGADLRGADLSGANLIGARFVGADLRDVSLHDACLEDADFTGANLEGAHLEQVDAQRAGFGKAKLRGATFFRANLDHACLIEADLRDCDLRLAHLARARLCRARLDAADLGRAVLRDADLSEASVHHTHFRGADLRRSRLRQLRRFESADFVHTDVRDVDFSGAYLLRRHVIDQNYLAEFRERSTINGAVYWLWWITSDCGRSALRWAGWTVVILLAFGFGYSRFPGDFDYGDHETPLSPYYFSVVTLTTLGFGDVLPATVAGQALVIAEVCVGYLMLGGLISLFASKMGTRGG